MIREDVTLVGGDERLALTLRSDLADDATPLPAFGESAQLLWNSTSATPIASDAVHAYRLERRVPLDGTDVDERNLPQEVDRCATAISFTKGCYLGQETVARIDAVGRVNQQLRLLRIDGEASAGDELTVDDKVVGRLTSVSWSPQYESLIGLGYVRRELAKQGDEVWIDSTRVTLI